MIRTTLRGSTNYRGYVRRNRRSGVRNKIVVLPSTTYSGEIAQRIGWEVDEAVCLRGVSESLNSEVDTQRLSSNIGQNPNVACVVGLGQEQKFCDVPVQNCPIQQSDSAEEAFRIGLETVRELTTDLRPERRKRVTISDLTVGVSLGDTADSTLLAAVPLVGQVVQELLSVGANVVVSGVGPFVSDIDATVSEEAAGQIDWAEPVTRDRKGASELSSSDITALWDHRDVDTVLQSGESLIRDARLGIMVSGDGVGNAVTGLAAAGTQLVIHITADGIEVTNPLVPVLTVTGESKRVSDGRYDIDAARTDKQELLDRILETVNGKETEAENLESASITLPVDSPS